jgi:hypothetical protein
VNSHYSSFAHHTFEQDQARNQLEQVPENGVLVLSGDQSFLFEYLQEVRGIRKDVTFVVYPFSLLVVGEALPPANSLAFFIDQQLGDRTCMFSFSPPAAILPYLKPPRALELDGVTFKLIKAEPGQPEFRIGNPAVWANYQLRNLDPGFLATYIPDAYEYETFAMYISCSRAAVNWLVDNGYQNDDFTLELSQIADSIEKALKRTDYPSGPALKIETFPEQPAIQESVVQESVPEEEHIP